MNQDEHRAMRESLGVHLLGQLSRDEDATLRAHLDGCAECRAELAEIEPVVAPLRRIDPARLGDQPVPPPWLGGQIVTRVRAENRVARRPRRGMLVAAAAVTVAALAGAGAGFVVGKGPDVPREPVTVAAAAGQVTASATVIPHTWGVEIDLDAAGFDKGAVYRVVVLDDSGRQVNAGEFIGTGAERMRCNLNSSVLRAQAAGFDVLDTGGSVVLHGDL